MIMVGTDSTYAPNEFLDDGRQDHPGLRRRPVQRGRRQARPEDRVRLRAVRRHHPGRRQSGKYEIGVSSFTINDERKQTVDMVSYFNAGTQWAAKTGAPVDPDNACGKKIAVQKGTVQVDDITARRRRAPTPASRRSRSTSTRRRTTPPRRSSPARTTRCSPTRRSCAYAVKQTNGQLALRRRHLRLGAVRLRGEEGPDRRSPQAIADALKALIADGTYKRSSTSGASRPARITDPAVNPTVVTP